MVAVKLTFNFSGSLTRADIVGKAATAKDKPKMPTGNDCKLLAKLKTASEPLANLEAKTAIANKLS